MRGIADQGEPFGDEGACDEIGQRKRARLVEGLDLPEMQAKAPFELAMELVGAQANDARSLAACLGPHQRRALSGERQDRERSGGQEMLLCAAVMVALMADRDDDAGLIVIPSMSGNPRTLSEP